MRFYVEKLKCLKGNHSCQKNSYLKFETAPVHFVAGVVAASVIDVGAGVAAVINVDVVVASVMDVGDMVADEADEC